MSFREFLADQGKASLRDADYPGAAVRNSIEDNLEAIDIDENSNYQELSNAYFWLVEYLFYMEDLNRSEGKYEASYLVQDYIAGIE